MKAKLCLIGGCRTEGLLLLDNGCVFYGEFDNADEDVSEETMIPIQTVISKPIEGIMTFPDGNFYDGLLFTDEDGMITPSDGEMFNQHGEFLYSIGEGTSDVVSLTSELLGDDEVLH